MHARWWFPERLEVDTAFCGGLLWGAALPGRRTGRKGPQSGPGGSGGEAEILGPLRSPFATQGRSHKELHSPPRKHKGDPKVAFAIYNELNRYFFLRT
jgi:hypothetical protein